MMQLGHNKQGRALSVLQRGNKTYKFCVQLLGMKLTVCFRMYPAGFYYQQSVLILITNNLWHFSIIKLARCTNFPNLFLE